MTHPPKTMHRPADPAPTTRHVEVGRLCDRCRGEGELPGGECESCGGTGEVGRLVTLEEFRAMACLDGPQRPTLAS